MDLNMYQDQVSFVKKSEIAVLHVSSCGERDLGYLLRAIAHRASDLGLNLDKIAFDNLTEG